MPDEVTVDRMYFGCGPSDTGHYFWKPDEVRYHVSTHTMLMLCPWGYEVDGTLQPARRTEGRCLLHRRGGWTALAWWDCSMDTRPGSCSAFLMRGEHDFDAMVAAFKESFPWAHARMKFALVPEEDGRD